MRVTELWQLGGPGICSREATGMTRDLAAEKSSSFKKLLLLMYMCIFMYLYMTSSQTLSIA